MGKNSFGRPQVTDVSIARRIAYRVLRQLDEQPGTDSRELLRILITKEKVDDADARLATSLVLGCLRFRMRLDAIISMNLAKPNQRLLPFVQTILRMVAYQQFYLDRLPAHAICNEAVGLVAVEGHGFDNRLRGFVNAVSRKMVELKTVDGTFSHMEEASLPSWMYGLLKARFGAGNMDAVVDALNGEPPIMLRVNTLVCSIEEAGDFLKENKIPFAPGKHVSECFVLSNNADLNRLLATSVFADGWFYVQDEASQMVATLVAPQPGERILDLCAAPGGKTTHLAALAGDKAKIIATDINPERLAVVEENLKRLHVSSVEVKLWNDVKGCDTTYDAVLVDAPCSGLGTIRRKPEIKWNLQYDDLLRLHEMQFKILSRSAQRVAPHGRLVYSTCSVSSQENEVVINAFLQSHPEWYCDKEHSFCSWPKCLEMDGFCVFTLKRREG